MYRYLYRNIDWDEHCIAIIGAKGVGKTTMLVQHVKTTFANKDEALFASLDNTWFANHTIFDLADEFCFYKYLIQRQICHEGLFMKRSKASRLENF